VADLFIRHVATFVSEAAVLWPVADMLNAAASLNALPLWIDSRPAPLGSAQDRCDSGTAFRMY